MADPSEPGDVRPINRIADHLHPSKLDRLERALARARAAGETRSVRRYEARLVRREGSDSGPRPRRGERGHERIGG